jgi:hypothetical protein
MSFTVEGARVVKIFFFPSFDLWKEEGRGLLFSQNIFFIVEWLGRGSWFFLFFF